MLRQKITVQGTEIEVVQTPLDRFGNIIDEDISEGRFIITTTKYLDPLIYRKGRDVTIAGVLTGSTKKLIDEIEYAYPVFEAREIYLFKEENFFPYTYWYDPVSTRPFIIHMPHYWYWP